MPKPDRPLSIAGCNEKLRKDLDAATRRIRDLESLVDTYQQQTLNVMSALVTAKREIRRLQGVVAGAEELLRTDLAHEHEIWCATTSETPGGCNCTRKKIVEWLQDNFPEGLDFRRASVSEERKKARQEDEADTPNQKVEVSEDGGE